MALATWIPLADATRSYECPKCGAPTITEGKGPVAKNSGGSGRIVTRTGPGFEYLVNDPSGARRAKTYGPPDPI